ncbi:hydantoinase subunit beta [Siminovitchia terrae]|uniref:Hydantoinase/oxoprolinase family protein n=1 Tax=Siminovitchia terrae TaxID=1914933 RepID=A0A429X293_SIMTE|nr:hydantoinase/oxoprolinase family protein [Siminovitchia terrae]RST57503.1 hydantoinase/oxoprolinase family protein [Siminovitchia terrae]GIN93587.1 hydantoinase subunit beta [Siminovitchia terrae]
MGIYRIGIDVGGTNTDAVILDEDFNVIGETKTPTTEDVSSGIYKAMKEVINSSNVPLSDIKYAMLGTTHATNAIVERKRLNSIAIIRLGAPATLAVKPLIGVPDDLREKLGKYVYIVQGGHEFDGREIMPLDEQELYRIAEEMKGQVDSVAITSVFSPVSRSHEERAAEIIKEVLGEELPVSLSCEIGSVGLLERENATILNASVVNVAKTTINGFVNALREEGIHDARVFLGQNDGTLMSVDYALKYPILTVACGPTNSLRGASYLSGHDNAIVVDVGGTTTDVGVLVSSFPRESSLAVEIGGARTNFRMPDLVSVGLGGGTIVRIQENGEFTIGPDSVGYRLTEKALVFGGDTLTTTDVVVALGKAEIGDSEKVRHLDQALLESIYEEMTSMVELAVDRMKTSADPVPVILVGGGSILVPATLEGASEVIRPKNHGVANAIGSAIAQVSGQVERVFSLDELGREKTLELAKQMAVNEAVEAGADPNTCDIVDIEDVPLAYLPGNATRVRVKAAGELAR